MSLFTKLFGLGDSDHYNKGIEYYNRGEYDKAVVEFEEVVATITDTSDPYYQLGMFYAAETHAHLGFAFYQQGNLTRAEEQFRSAIDENARYPDLHYHLGVICEKQGRHDEAIEALQSAVTINPEYMEAYCQLAIALSESGRSDEAVKAFEKATKFGLSVPMPDTPHIAEARDRYLKPPIIRHTSRSRAPLRISCRRQSGGNSVFMTSSSRGAPERSDIPCVSDRGRHRLGYCAQARTHSHRLVP